MHGAEYTWTKELCEADSDGDGQTNGQELGDPCCVWVAGQTDTAYMMGFSPSHPGHAGSKQGPDYAAPSCSDAGPTPTLEQLIFNPGEEQRHVDWRIKNYTIPNARTTYVDFVFNFDDVDHDLFHIVLGEAIVDQPRHLHHYVVSGYADRIDPELEGVALTDDELPDAFKGPGNALSGWAPGSKIWAAPLFAGTPVGEAARVRSFKVNVHFTDGDLHPGSISQDGLRMYYTPTLREHAVDQSTPLWISQNPNMVIPPGAGRWFVTRTCEVQDPCEDATEEEVRAITADWGIDDDMSCPILAWAGGCDHEEVGEYISFFCPKSCKVDDCSGFKEDGTLPIYGINYHAHLLGTEMYFTLKRDGLVHNLASTSVWHYDDQKTFDLLPYNLSIRVGDVLQSTCVFNSAQREGMTTFYLETVDEMCIHALSTIRHTSMPKPVLPFVCKGQAWTGQLSADEDALFIAESHPIETAELVYEPDIIGSLDDHQPLLPTHLCPDGSQAMPDMCQATSGEMEWSDDLCCAARDHVGPLAVSSCRGDTVRVVGQPCYMYKALNTVLYSYMCCTPWTTTNTTETATSYTSTTATVSTSTTTAHAATRTQTTDSQQGLGQGGPRAQTTEAQSQISGAAPSTRGTWAGVTAILAAVLGS
jgi:hypothetical protein